MYTTGRARCAVGTTCLRLSADFVSPYTHGWLFAARHENNCAGMQRESLAVVEE
jgi:hypothetical protein